MPMSSRTSETGWEHASHGGVMSFSRGAEVRSPEIGTPSQHSPMNRAKIVSGVQTAPSRIVQDAVVTHQHDPADDAAKCGSTVTRYDTVIEQFVTLNCVISCRQ